ncbi:expressed unknown protein [Seminavis robusta]|uniref:EF-hand domain-containing protein n=1 Tax=Seminavis robusta TaxID=568900 RepID=A0A9N8F125_9STRA|nr:expressed unknown protein [Seminavis robusta]|eukprot:Sro2223_g319700.1 n/a (1410) ;mRNA; r:7280-11509
MTSLAAAAAPSGPPPIPPSPHNASAMTTTSRPPPPSVSSPNSRLSSYLKMTAQDVDRMTEASRALQASLLQVPIPDHLQTPQDNDADNRCHTHLDATSESVHKLIDQKGGALGLHSMLVTASQQCQNSIVESFLSRMMASGLTEAEAKAGLVIFHEMDKSSKLKLFFEILAASRDTESAESAANTTTEDDTTTMDTTTSASDAKPPQQYPPDDHSKENALPNNNDAPAAKGTPDKRAISIPRLDRDGATSLFLTILTAISCCVHSKEDDDTALKPVVTQDEDISSKDSFDNPPKEMTKTGETELDGTPKAPPLPTHHHHHPVVVGLSEQLQKEIGQQAREASNQLIEFTSKQQQKLQMSFDNFGEWYNCGGCTVVPWLELLHLSKWRINNNNNNHAAAAQVVPPPSALALSRKFPPKSSKKPYGSLSSMLREDEEAMQRMTNGSSAAHHQYPHSRTVVTFDFSASVDSGAATCAQPLCISISEESLTVLRSLVYKSGLIYRSAAEVCKTIMRSAHKRLWDGRPLVTLRRDDFRQIVRSLLTPQRSANRTPSHFSASDAENFGMVLEDFFACYEGNFHQSTTSYHPLSHDEVNAKELAVGFCLLCAGNKSTKLATGFELLDDARVGFLTQQQLMRFLRAYLTMMVGTSLLRESHARKRTPLQHDRKEEMRAAVENGALWTLRHFLKKTREKHPEAHVKDAYTFGLFAEWYSQGGYNVAPWLELLDLNKMVSLLGEPGSFSAMPQTQQRPNSHSSVRECRSSHRRQHHNRTAAPPVQVLFTFPLANQRSLIVLREDAVYVRGVVEQLGVLSLSAPDIWSTLINEVKKRPELTRGIKPRPKKGSEPEKNTLIDSRSFVEMMEVVLQSAVGSSRKRAATGTSKLSSSVQELLSNLFHSYDLKQTNMVALNELMGGLALLCGGKKSTKLAFAFGVFDGRQKPKARKVKNHKPSLKDQSLDTRELYLFLRSFLIVLFSCCCQTLEMADNSVDRYIGDTANMVADDVMRYQWHTRKKDRIDFDEFGEWYNEGGFEIAPWLELLDLKKWVLVDNFDALDNQASAPSTASADAARSLSPKRAVESKQSPTCPPPPPEDVLDPSFFESDDIMQMDSIDEMDIMLMPSHDKDGDLLPVSKFTYSPSQDRILEQHQSAGDDTQRQPLKFHLLSEEDEKGGFMLSISQRRIRHFRQVMMDSGLPDVSTETVCAAILSHASPKDAKAKNASQCITKDDFDAAVHEILGIKDQRAGAEDHSCLLEVLSFIFSGFDPEESGKADAFQVACGFTVLCRGKKSDKLEYAFDVLDKDKKGELTRMDMLNYMRSFLTVLLGIGCSPSLETDEVEDSLTSMSGDETCDRSVSSVVKAVDAGANWAVSQAFKRREGLGDTLSFDDFAAWYTDEGHLSIPWVELLSLRKWLL